MAYQDLASYHQAIQRAAGQQQARGAADSRYAVSDYDAISRNVGASYQQFARLFEQLVGRAPDQTEQGSFFDTVLQGGREQTGLHESGSLADLRDPTAQFIQDNFQKAAEQQAQLELQGQQAEAMRLADFSRQQGRTAIADVEARLMDYQSRLFEKLRPNFITSMHMQNLGNTGGFNEAVAGAQKDLAADASNYLSDQYLQNELKANEIAYGGQAAPYMFQQQQAMQRVPYLQQMGEAALNRNFQTRQSELDWSRQMQLAQMQQQKQPSFLKQMGGQLLANTLYGGAGALGRSFQGMGAKAPPMPLNSQLSLLQGDGYARYS